MGRNGCANPHDPCQCDYHGHGRNREYSTNIKRLCPAGGCDRPRGTRRPLPWAAHSGRRCGAPAIITRNQVVVVQFKGNGLHITTDGRALERGAVGDRVRIMNLSSRATLFGQVQQDGDRKSVV